MQSQEKKNCSISSDTKTWTNTYNIIETQRIGEKLVFIDISGLNDATDEENNIRKVTDAIAEHPNFRAFFDIVKFYWFQIRFKCGYNPYTIYDIISNKRFLEEYYYY